MHQGHWKMIRLAAKGRRDSQWTRLVICLLICLTGIVGVLQANPLGGRTTWTGLTVTAALVVIAGLTAHRSWRDYTQRGQMLDLARGRTSVIAAELRARNIP
jgi:hypothetical protein